METALRSRKFPRFIAAALLAAAFFAVPPLRADLPPLIPRLAFYGGAEKSNFRVSPDGTRLAPRDGQLNLIPGGLSDRSGKP